MSSKKNSVKKKKNSEESFETLLNRLEVIVGKMESGGLSLDESMSLYEEGIKKADTLTAKLADARNKVMKLVENKDGDMSLDVFDEDEYS
ncbi:MAG: exodeoxyribonuclease VII small subunit [Candidatus Latescibacteria bacterium]|nr:exodeoxyribonuclease VII small subunit [Candidatus Latescibacterota bacterium]